MPRGTKRETPPPNGDPINVRPKGQPSSAELDYAHGRRNMPPRPHEMSEDTQEHTATQFGDRLSNVKTREQTFADSGAGGALKQPVIDRLVDKTMTVQTAGESLKRHWDIMMGAPDRPKPAWYFGHNRRTTRSANEYGIDPTTAIQAGGAMSPQNDPESEHTANRAMMDAHTRRRQVRATEDIYTVPTETEQKKGIKPRKVMVRGERRTLAAMHPDDMQAVTAAANAKKVTHAEDFNLPGFRKAGTGRKQGFGTLDPTTDYNAVEEMEAAKVHLYTDTTINSVPDSPLHHEYEMRFGDQDAARDVRLGRESDLKGGGGLGDRLRAVRQGPAAMRQQKKDSRKGIGYQSETLRGVPDRVDLYGLMKGTDNPLEEAYHHPILGVKGNAVPDTWMNTLLSDQEIEDMPDSASPAKLMGSQSATTSSSIGPTSEGLQHTFPGPAEAAAHGGKPWSGDASFGMGSLMAMQHAAEIAREPESQTNIPPVMMQEMTWVHGRLRVAQSVRNMLSRSKGQPTSVAPGTAATRIAKLTSGDLAGEKEFRPSDMEYRPNPNDTPGTFSRGYDNPLTRDEGISVIPASGGHTATTAGSGTRRSNRNLAMSHFHEQAAGPAPTDAARRSAILGAQVGYQASRAGGGSAWHEEPAKKTPSDHPLSRGF